MISKFLTGLNDLQKKLLVGALVIVIIAFFDRLLIGPTMAKLASINSEIIREENNIKQDIKFLTYKNRINNEHEKTTLYLSKVIPTEEELISSFLKTLEGLAAQVNVAIVKVNPSAGTSTNEYLRYQADLECSGNLADVVSFMHLINSSKQLLKVVKYNLSGKKSESNEVKANMTIERILVSSTNEKPMPVVVKDINAL